MEEVDTICLIAIRSMQLFMLDISTHFRPNLLGRIRLMDRYGPVNIGLVVYQAEQVQVHSSASVLGFAVLEGK